VCNELHRTAPAGGMTASCAADPRGEGCSDQLVTVAGGRACPKGRPRGRRFQRARVVMESLLGPLPPPLTYSRHTGDPGGALPLRGGRGGLHIRRWGALDPVMRVFV
jgi:hypothetical protein